MSADQSTRPVTGSNGVGVAGFVTGLLGALLSWFPLAGLILGLLGIVLGGLGMSRDAAAVRRPAWRSRVSSSVCSPW